MEKQEIKTATNRVRQGNFSHCWSSVTKTSIIAAVLPLLVFFTNNKRNTSVNQPCCDRFFKATFYDKSRYRQNLRITPYFIRRTLL
jgi:hypothetical protein